MSKSLKIINFISFIFISSFISFNIAYWIGENYFFDKLFYKKSTIYGYSKFGPFSLNNELEDKIKYRLSDLISLIYSDKLKDTENFKIAIIGDSMSYGTGVKTENTFAETLEKKLNKIKPTKVYNLSLPGDNILEFYFKYILAEQKIQPDLYIFGIVDNDLLVRDNFVYEDQNTITNDITFKCIEKETFAYKQNSNYNWEEFIINAYYPSFDDKYNNVCYLNEFLSKVINGKEIFIHYDKLFTSNNHDSEHTKKRNEIMKKYSDLITDHDGYIIKLNETNFQYQPVSEKESHPSKESHEFYANLLYKEIISNKKRSFTMK